MASCPVRGRHRGRGSSGDHYGPPSAAAGGRTMNYRFRHFAALVAVVSAATFAGASTPVRGAGPVDAAELSVTASMSETSALIGDSFEFSTEVVNGGNEATLPLVAHMNVVSLDLKTYVDPEDWSPRRTQSIAPIAAGSSSTQTWKFNPILKGEVSVYIVVMQVDGEPAAASHLVASPPIQVHVRQQRTLNPGGVLPVVLAVPGVIAVAFAGLRIRRRRSRGAW